ncbi:MAG: methyl-accepting chemotaxis protein [Treponema sp.]|jgi:methyl-accepting chemotaxis protein|nr:methyl-accepting chemotaxis protein [Treponema sp.]
MTDQALRSVIDKFTLEYNKGIVLGKINSDSMGIIMKNMQNISAEMQEILAAVEEITATSKSTSNNTEHIDASMKTMLSENTSMGAIIKESSKGLEQTKEKAQNLQNGFLSLESSLKEIGKLSGEIQDMAELTNVLSINASIEAARAGKAGEGFRIVAGEVRNFSNKTNTFADKITQAIKEFLKVLKSMNEDMTGFMTIMKNFTAVLEQMRTVFNQNSATAEKSAGEIAEIVTAAKEESAALSIAMTSLISVSELLRDTNAMADMLKKSGQSLDKLLS